MQSMRKTPEIIGNRVRTETLMVILAIGASVLEGIIPRPVPFIKPGLANVVTVAAIARYGLWTGLRVNILRAFGTALFIGTLATPTFILSLSGGISSAMVMGVFKKFFSVTGMSVSGSLASIFTQLFAATLLLPGLPAGSLIIPLAVWGTLSGTITGILAIVLLRNGFPWISDPGVDAARLQE
jgi:heptaprenyl diphosphate synthase